MSISHVLCSQEWGDPVRLRIVTHDQSLCGAYFAILQILLIVAPYRQIDDFRWRLQAWWEHWVRSPQTTVVSLNEWLPLHSTSSLFSLLKKEFVVPWTWAGRWQGLSQTSHTCFLIVRKIWSIQQPMTRFLLSINWLHQWIPDIWHVYIVSSEQMADVVVVLSIQYYNILWLWCHQVIGFLF